MVEDEFGSKISYPKSWYSKHLVLEPLFSTHEKAFEYLPRLLSTMLVYILGSIYDMLPKRVNALTHIATFCMMFWPFGSAIEGLVHCRPPIIINITHLYKKVFVVVLYGSNNGIYLLAFGIADA